jgi:polysaccharide deacetylase family protein (PEP-CTERM system associated)
MVVNALSVDVEEYYHAAIFRHGASSGIRPGLYESRVERSMDRLVDLLKTHHARATFFILGEVAAAHPSIVRRIAAEHHEIACHGDRHEDVYRQTPQEFRADIRRAKAQLEDIVSEPVVGYRAPNFSIGPAQSWAYEILVEEGFRYDSSSYPIKHDRYGEPAAPRFPYEICRSGSGSLMEFPVGTARLLGVNLPIGGGGYFRLSPFAFVRLGIQHVNIRERRPVMFYLHPWELDPGQPRPQMAWRHRFRHYVGVDKHEAKLGWLLERFCFSTARDVLDDCAQPGALLTPARAAAITADQSGVPA